jgi:hypothetical protein
LEKNPKRSAIAWLTARPAWIRNTFSLTEQERLLVVCVLVSVVLGVIVRHYRQIYREKHPQAEVSASRSAVAKDVYIIP